MKKLSVFVLVIVSSVILTSSKFVKVNKVSGPSIDIIFFFGDREIIKGQDSFTLEKDMATKTWSSKTLWFDDVWFDVSVRDGNASGIQLITVEDEAGSAEYQISGNSFTLKFKSANQNHLALLKGGRVQKDTIFY